MKGYGQFCPVAKAAEVIGERWTPLIVRELMCGSTRFNELRRGNPLMSPSILSQRLKSLERAGVLEKQAAGDRGGAIEYRLTAAGEELGPIIMQLGEWGTRWARSQFSPHDFDPALLMWDMRRRVETQRFPAGRTVVFFEFLDAPARQRFWWLIVQHGEVDVCLKDPGHQIDLRLRAGARVMADIWMGYRSLRGAVRAGEVEMQGRPALERGLPDWLGYSVFAGQPVA